MIFMDCETVGLCGPAVTIQYAYDDGPIQIHDIWLEPAVDTLKLIEEMMTHDVVGFNLSFDMFQLNKIYNMLLMLAERHGGNAVPEDHIEELAEIEPLARDGLCLKPKRACDVMCVARKTKYQSTMDRRDIVIKKVPRALAFRLAELLEQKITLSEIYFARRKDKLAPRWRVDDTEVPEFKNVILSFKASSGLKALAVDALNLDEAKQFKEIGPSKDKFPIEAPWAPFALAISSKDSRWYGEIKIGKKHVKGYTWPQYVRYHIDHWKFHVSARKYAEDDVLYTRELYKYFGSPEPGDDDSELTCMVAAVRWKGYTINIEKLEGLLRLAIKRSQSVPTSPRQVKNYIFACLSEVEQVVLKGSTKKTVLEEIAKWSGQPCIVCQGKKCIVCDNTGEINHPASERARKVLDARKALKEIDLYKKLLMAGRFHASFNVIGALSSRMSGSDRLNAQGINKTKDVRSSFTLSSVGLDVLCGGDFSGFEVVLAVAVYDDSDLKRELLTCGKCGAQMLPQQVGPPKCACGSKSGKKIHALFGVHVYPGMTYEQILATDGTSDDKYTRCKSAVFALLYGGEGYTLKTRLGVDQETADAACEKFFRAYPKVGIEREKVRAMFGSMSQPGGIGSKIEWHEPSDYIESLFGFRRYFTLENLICKSLFEIANCPPKEWQKVQIKVQRREGRIQTAGGAVQSALYGSAFAIQASNVRAAANHVIQSSGAQITKHVQRKIWDLQPSGVTKWIVQPCNVHDEILTPTHPDHVANVSKAVTDAVESFRAKVPLITMDWKTGLNSWADKGK